MNEIQKRMEQLDADNKSKILRHFSMQEEALAVLKEERLGLLETAKVLLSKNQEQNLVIAELRQKLRESEVADILQIKQEESRRLEEALHGERARSTVLEEDLQRMNTAMHEEQAKFVVLEEEYAQLKESKESLQKAVAEVQKKNSEMEQVIMELEAECTSLKKELSATNMRSVDILQENEQLKAQLQKLRGSLDAFVDLLTI